MATQKAPVKIAITGPAGQIGYSLLFRIASGDMLGKDQPVILQLIELPHALKALQGVVMELEDCAFPLLKGVVQTSDLHKGFEDADYALLVGAKPRGKGMERGDLLKDNGAIFAPIGKVGRFALSLPLFWVTLLTLALNWHLLVSIRLCLTCSGHVGRGQEVGQVHRGRQPGQHQLPDRRLQRAQPEAGELLGHDSTGPQPRAGADRPQNRLRCHRH